MGFLEAIGFKGMTITAGDSFDDFTTLTPICSRMLMHFLLFVDRKALAVYDGFERGVYQLADARQ